MKTRIPGLAGLLLGVAIFGWHGPAAGQAALKAPDIAQIGDLGMLETSRNQFDMQFRGKVFSDRLRYQGMASTDVFSRDGRPKQYLSFFLDWSGTVNCLPDVMLGEGLDQLPDQGTPVRLSGHVADYHSSSDFAILLDHCELTALS